MHFKLSVGGELLRPGPADPLIFDINCWKSVYFNYLPIRPILCISLEMQDCTKEAAVRDEISQFDGES